jgi:hypothetical protein
LGSVDIFKISGEINLKTGEFTGLFYTPAKDDKEVMTKGLSGSFGGMIEGVPVGVGSSVSSSETYDFMKDKITESSKEVNGGVGVANFSGSVSLANQKNEDGTNTKTAKTSISPLSGSAGAGVVMEWNILEVGIRIENKQ